MNVKVILIAAVLAIAAGGAAFVLNGGGSSSPPAQTQVQQPGVVLPVIPAPATTRADDDAIGKIKIRP